MFVLSKNVLVLRRTSMYCPKCSSDTMIPVDLRFLWNLFNVHVRGQKIRYTRLRKQLFFCPHCRKFYIMSDL